MNTRRTFVGTGDIPDLNTVIRVVVVDDDSSSCQVMCYLLRRLNLGVQGFIDPAKCLESVERNPPDVVITDYSMPGIDGLGVLKRVMEISPTTDVIMVTGNADKQVAIQALKLGAYDFFEKPVNPEELIATVQRTLACRSLRSERDRFAEQVSYLSGREAQRWGIEAFVGKSEGIRKILGDIRLLHCNSTVPVLITGESGTGKELVARAIHYGGSRASRPFVPVNCCAVPGELWESVFFGHMHGSFTGATADKKGCFEVADQGTLFLDEVGDMPVLLQTKLLRVLEDGIVVPVGATKERKVDVRVIASTNADLQERMRGGAFRSDLYHRLAAFRIQIPPIRERRADIPPLVRHFLAAFAREMGLPAPPSMSSEALSTMQRYDYPGNVRELRNLVEQAIIRCDGRTIEPVHLRIEQSLPQDKSRGTAGADSSIEATVADLPFNIHAAETELIRRAMKQVNGNVSRCAALLGITRTKLYRKLDSMGDAGSR
jgi:DNA-binding NtrC family response regulator